MKLATVNPRLDFNIDDLFEKEVRNKEYADGRISLFTFHLILNL